MQTVIRITFGIFLFALQFSSGLLRAQEAALDYPIPEELQGYERTVLVGHFPSPVHALTEVQKEDTSYFWKHNTSVMSPMDDLKIESFGAYIFYNEQWNLRATFGPKDFVKLFNCPNAILKKGEPFTYQKNWRRSETLFGGWALWYFIATNLEGEKVIGYAKLYTSSEKVNEATQIKNH